MTDMQNIMVDVMTDMQNNIDEDTAAAIMAGDEDALQKLMQDAVKQYMAKIGEMEPAEEMTELTIKCQRVKVDVSGKEKIAWMPQNPDFPPGGRCPVLRIWNRRRRGMAD